MAGLLLPIVYWNSRNIQNTCPNLGGNAIDPHLICYFWRKTDVHLVFFIRSVSCPRGSPLRAENGINAFLFILLVIAAVGAIQAHPQVWIGVDFILLRQANIICSYIELGDDD